MADADPQSVKSWFAAKSCNHAANSIVTVGAAARFDSDDAWLESDLVVGDEYFRSRDFVEMGDRAHGFTA